MNKQIIKLIALLLLCNYGLADVNYGSMFYVDPADVSVSVLGQLFGTVGTVLSGNSIILSKIFYYFNNGILVFTAVLLSYTMFMTIIGTANDGKALGNNFNYFTIIRSGLGMASLVPLANGYCTVQIVIMWAILQGVGFANYLWSEAVVLIHENGGFSSAAMQDDYTSAGVTSTMLNDLAMGNADPPTQPYDVTVGIPSVVLLRSALCTQAVYDYDSKAAVGITKAPMQSDYGYFVENDGTLCFGTRFMSSSGSVSYNCQCGEYQVPYSCGSGSSPAVSSNTSDQSTGLYGSNSANILSTAASIMSLAKDLYISLKTTPASTMCQTYSPQAETNMCPSATNVINIANTDAQYIVSYQLSQSDSNPTANCPNWVQSATSEGWMLAVVHYYDMTSCATSATDSYTCMMPYSTAQTTDNNIISNSNYQPCMTQNSGYNSSQLCTNLDSSVTNTWNNAEDLVKQIYSYNGMISGIYNSTDSTVSSSKSAFASYYNDLLEKYIDVFIKTKYTPGELGTDLTWKYGNQRPVINGLMALVNHVVGKVLGLDAYGNRAPGELFSTSSVSHHPPNTSSDCKACTSLTECSGCLNTEGWGLLGAIYAENYPTRATQMDPVSSLKIVGKDALTYSLTYMSKTIDTVYKNLKNTAVTAAATLNAVAAAFFPVFTLLQTGTGPEKVALFTAINMFISIIVTIHKTLLLAWMPVAAVAAIVFLTIGIMLYVYIPFLPLVLFFSGVISWVIAVVEAMVAAPMIAMGITHPKGADFLGKSEQSAMLLLAVFIRPATIIIGFIIAISLSYVSMRLLNISFAVLFVQGLDAIGGSSTGTMVLGGTSMMIIYTYCCVAILSQTFSLIYQVPDKVMRWIGMPQDQTSAAAIEMARGFKSGVSDVSGGAASAVGDSSKSSGVGDYKVQGTYGRFTRKTSSTSKSEGGQEDSPDSSDDDQVKNAGGKEIESVAADSATSTNVTDNTEAQIEQTEEDAAAAAASKEQFDPISGQRKGDGSAE